MAENSPEKWTRSSTESIRDPLTPKKWKRGEYYYNHYEKYYPDSELPANPIERANLTVKLLLEMYEQAYKDTIDLGMFRPTELEISSHSFVDIKNGTRLQIYVRKTP